jgi:hypothetical protein
LLALPPELLAVVAEHLSVSGRRSLAGTCSALGALILDCANRLTLHLGNDSSISAALLAAVRRQHGALHLRLALSQTITARRLKGQLFALGLCPAVEGRELAHITVSGLCRHRSHQLCGSLGSFCTVYKWLSLLPMQGHDQWTHQASIQAVHNFPNLQCLTVKGCAIPFPALKPLLQLRLPDGIHLRKSQLCSEAVYDSRWLLHLLSCEGPKYLAITGSLNELPLQFVPPEESHLPASLTHLVLDGPGVGV